MAKAGSIFGLITVFCVFLLPACAEDSAVRPSETQKRQAPMSATELLPYQVCGSDTDCVKANNGCCDCANGGEDVAININRLKEFESLFDCMDIMCTMLARTPPCGSGLVTCVEHRCRYVEPQ